jgi:hypothetical protein
MRKPGVRSARSITPWNSRLIFGCQTSRRTMGRARQRWVLCQGLADHYVKPVISPVRLDRLTLPHGQRLVVETRNAETSGGAPAQRGWHGQQLQSPQTLWELASQLSEQIPSNISQPVSKSVAGLQVFTRSGRTAPVTQSRRIPATRLAFQPPGSSVRLRESSGTSASSSIADVKQSRSSPYRLSGSQKSSLRIYGRLTSYKPYARRGKAGSASNV